MQIVATLFFLACFGLGLATVWQMVSGHFDQILNALTLGAPEPASDHPAPSAQIIAFPRAVTVHVPERLAA